MIVKKLSKQEVRNKDGVSQYHFNTSTEHKLPVLGFLRILSFSSRTEKIGILYSMYTS